MLKNKICSLVVVLTVTFLASQAVYADTCGANLTGPFVAAQANALCTKLPANLGEQQIVTEGVNVGDALETVAGAGTTVSDAAELSASVHLHRITGANGTVGWKFAAANPVGSVEILLNTTAGVAKIYADAGGTVNGGSVDAAFSALTGIKPIICVKTAALTYLCA